MARPQVCHWHILERTAAVAGSGDRLLVSLAMDAQAMTDFEFIRHNLVGFLLNSGAWLTVGALIGAFQFLSLQWTVRMLVVGRGLVLPVGVQLARFALIALILTAIAWSSGAFPLLVTAAGIVVARTLIIQWGAQA
jgi:hypothetical protein